MTARARNQLALRNPTRAAPLLWLLAGLVPGSALGCGGGGDSPDAGDAGDAGDGDGDGAVPMGIVRIGTPDPVTERRYVPLAPGGDLLLETLGQGGYHVGVVLQLEGFGNTAWVDVTLRSLAPGADGEVSTAPTRSPELLACDDLRMPRVCSRGPIIIMTAGLAENSALDGLHVEIGATARNREGVQAEATTDAYLRFSPGVDPPDEDAGM